MKTYEKVDDITLEAIRKDAARLPGFKEISQHMVFYIKLDGKGTTA